MRSFAYGLLIAHTKHQERNLFQLFFTAPAAASGQTVTQLSLVSFRI
jgi:hypothetical protein